MAVRDNARPGMINVIFSLFEFGQPAIDFELTPESIIQDYLYVLTTHAKKLGQKGLTMLEKILEHDPKIVLHAYEQDPIMSLNITPVQYALQQAIKGESREAVQSVLKLGDKGAINLEEVSKEGKSSPLHCAISVKQADTAIMLLDAGADITLPGIGGLSPLQAAMRNSLLTVALRLLDSSTEELAPDMIYHAASVIEGGVEMMKHLIQKGVDANWQSETGETVLTSACYAGNVEAVRYLLDEVALDVKGSGRETYLEGGYPPIHAAVKSNSPATLQVLLDHGVDVNQCRTDLQMRPIHVAALLGKTAAVDWLIDNGVDLYKVINTKDDQNITAIHLAAGYGHCDTLIKLIEKGQMHVDIRTANGFTPLDFSLKRFSFDVVKVLVDHGAASDSLSIQLAIQTGGLSDEVLELIEKNKVV
jgi:ankyrin repeat protein